VSGVPPQNVGGAGPRGERDDPRSERD
jgi:hypothetical protein